MTDKNVSDAIDDAMRNSYHAPDEAQFLDEDGEPTIDFIAADDLRRMATELIDEFSELNHLRDFQRYPITYLWKRDGGKTGGKEVLGKCTKAAGLVKYFSESTFVIWLAANYVNQTWFSRQQVEALLYHELCHAQIVIDGEGKEKPRLAAHDFQGFVGEIQHFGDWMGDLHAARQAFEKRQLSMFDEQNP